MIDRRIGKIKIRRGTDSQRKTILFPEGELLYTIDNKRVYVGDGSTVGGIYISNKNYIVTQISPLPSKSLYGDIIHNITDSTTYIIGSAGDGSLSAILIADVKCCKNIKDQLNDLKTKVGVISAKLATFKPPTPTVPVVVTGDTISFVIQPSNVSINIGETATFTASAVGPGIITYQWYRTDSGVIQGANSTTYEILKTESTDASLFYCVANSSQLGKLKSNDALLTLDGNSILFDPEGYYILTENGEYIDWELSSNTAPIIRTQPISQSTSILVPKTLTVLAEGLAPLKYQWYKDGQIIEGAIENSYTESNPTKTSVYKCKVYNIVGEVYSSNATISIQSPPVISKQPVSQNLSKDSLLLLTVEATGSSPLTYTWYKDNTLMSGANTNTYRIEKSQLSDTGNYKCIIQNESGSITSDIVLISVKDAFSADINISGDIGNLILTDILKILGWDTKLAVSASVQIKTGVTIYSNYVDRPAFLIDSLPIGSSITLINNGKIIGKGGTGGDGSREGKNVFIKSTAGKIGGDGLSVKQSIKLTNNGIIAGGGGGGGGGGSNFGVIQGTPIIGSEGTINGTGGKGGDGGNYANSGGTGGDLGQNGATGKSDATGGSIGGPSGYSIDGKNFVTFDKAGDIRGPQK